MIAYAEMYVVDGLATTDYFTKAFGFRQVATADQDGSRSVLLHNGGVPLVITTPTRRDGPVAEWLARHGDGVADIAAYADLADLHRFVDRAHTAGLRTIELLAEGPAVRIRTTGAGTLRHTMIDPGEAIPSLPPGFDWTTEPHIAPANPALCLTGIDHIAICLPTGDLGPTADTYQQAFGMDLISSDEITVGPTGMRSHVLRGGGLTIVMAEPDPYRQPGQVNRFLALHRGPGVQHLAFGTGDIVAAVRAMSPRGARFLPTPSAYYANLAERMADDPAVMACLEDLHQTGVLADRDEFGNLYQIFATSPFERGTVFVELIQRDGAHSFGDNNVKALFRAREASDVQLDHAPDPTPLSA